MNKWQPKLLFFILLALQVVFFLTLIAQRRMVGGHDGFYYYTLQYYFLNHVVGHGEIPLWMPFLTQGVASPLLYLIQAGIMQNIFFLIGHGLQGFNFLPLFYVGMFVDELLLLTGTWFLARRYYSSAPTAFFVSISVMGSCLWMLQPSFNFHIYYALPLILHFLHSFLEKGRWRYLFLAGNLTAMQVMVNPPYFLSVMTLVIFLYFLFYAVCHAKEIRQQIQNLRWDARAIAALFGIAACFGAGYVFINIGSDQVVYAVQGRNPDGTTPLDIFLTYGRNHNVTKWLELLLRFSPAMDFTLYLGLLSVPMCIFGLTLGFQRSNIHLLLLILTLVMFSLGTSVAAFFYYFWPMMKYYRHVALIAPVIKIFLCFLSGYGFEAVFVKGIPTERQVLLKRISWGVAFLMAGVAAALVGLIVSNNPLAVKGLINRMVDSSPGGLPVIRLMFHPDVLAPRLQQTVCFAFLIAIICVFLPSYGQKYRQALLCLVLLLHTVDVYGYKFSESFLRTTPVDEQHYQMTSFQKMPYTKRRELSSLKKNPRASILGVLPTPEVIYWTTNAFLFNDEPGSSFRLFFWSSPFNELLYAYRGLPLKEGVAPSTESSEQLTFPLEHPAAQKFAGVAQDKIQFFSGAVLMQDKERIAREITRPEYAGDFPFLFGSDIPQRGILTFPDGEEESSFVKDTHARLDVPYRVERFDADHLNVHVDIPGDKPAWVFYSDVWHPFWKATVNGHPVPVLKANLAYKAVPVEAGTNDVHFYFESKKTSCLQLLFGLNAVFWMGMMAFLIGKIYV